MLENWPADPSPWRTRVNQDAMRCRAQAALVRPRLKSLLLEPLNRAGLPPLVLKGAALADRYPAPGLRPMDDVDLLFPPEERSRAVDLLCEAGWRPNPRPEPHYAVELKHRELPGLPLDVHADIAMPQEQAIRLSAGELWSRRRPSSLLDQPTFGLDPEVELLVLATHAAKRFHTFDRLLWAVDAAVVIQTASAQGRAIDWSEVSDLSARAAARSALAVLLNQAARLGADSPAELRELPGGKTRRRMLEPVIAPEWPLRSVDDALRHRLAYALIDDPVLRGRWTAREVTENGWERAPLRAATMAVKVVRRWWLLRRGRFG